MPTLFDTLQQNLGQQAATPAVGQGKRLQDLLKAQQGKAAGPTTGPAASALGEQAAAVQTQAAGREQVIQGQLAAQGLQQQQLEQQRQSQQQMAEVESKRQSLLQNAQLQTSQILNEAKREGKQLSFDKDAIKIEQLGFNLRLQDDQYMQALQIQAGKQRLNNSVDFNVAMQKSILQDNYDILKSNLNVETILAGNAQAAEKELARMTLDQALELGKDQIKAENKKAMYKSIGGMVTGGAMAFAKGS